MTLAAGTHQSLIQTKPYGKVLMVTENRFQMENNVKDFWEGVSDLSR